MDGKVKPRQAEEAYCFFSEPKHGPCLIPNNQTGVFNREVLSTGSSDTGSSGIYYFLGAMGQRNEGAMEDPLCKTTEVFSSPRGLSWEYCAGFRSFPSSI